MFSSAMHWPLDLFSLAVNYRIILTDQKSFSRSSFPINLRCSGIEIKYWGQAHGSFNLLLDNIKDNPFIIIIIFFFLSEGLRRKGQNPLLWFLHSVLLLIEALSGTKACLSDKLAVLFPSHIWNCRCSVSY